VTLPNRLTIVLGPLAAPLAEHCARTLRTPSEAVRAAVAAMLGVEVPEVPRGNPQFPAQAADAAAARWGNRRRRKKK